MKRVLGRLIVLFGLGIPVLSNARPYDVFIDISTEDDLHDLRLTDAIDELTLERLVELLQRGVDLNAAERRTLYELPNLTMAEVDAIIAYRKEVGHIADPFSLVAQGVISRDKLAAIAAFLVIVPIDEERIPIDGVARLQSRYSQEDTGPPAFALQVRARSADNLRVGLVTHSTRHTVGRVHFDPARQALTAKHPSWHLRLPKLYVHWQGERLSVIAGTYRVGFGQRLTFDTTDQISPSGFVGDHDVFRSAELTRKCKESSGELPESPCSGTNGDIYVTPDFRSKDGLLGLAVTWRDLRAFGLQTKLTAFASYQPRSIYQYELYDRRTCADPRRDDDPQCSAPSVFVTAEKPLERSARHSFQTLPNVYAEAIAGANASVELASGTHLGVTGYASHIDWLIDGADLDFQEWSSLPWGGDFGAVGVDLAHTLGITDIFAEVARSLDSTPQGGGGFGGVLRTVTPSDSGEVEASLRAYDSSFQNPHARPIAASDEYDGLRARDELGARLRTIHDLTSFLTLRSSVDLWRTPSSRQNKLHSIARFNAKATESLDLGVWFLYQDKDLGRGGRGQCFEVSVEFDENGEPVPCAGQKLQFSGRTRYAPRKTLWFDLQYQHKFLDDEKYQTKFRQDLAVVGIVTAKPHRDLRLRVRSRFTFEDIIDTSSLEESWWTYFDASYKLRKRDTLRARYDLVVHLDKRASTMTRRPSPENWLWLEYVAHF